MLFNRKLYLAIILAIAGCTAGGEELDPFSGARVATGKHEFVMDVGEIRMSLHPVRTARNYPVPPTIAVSFRWSPVAYERFFKEHGWRRPTAADWDRAAAIEAAFCESCHFSPYGYVREIQEADPTAEYKAHVMSNGEIRVEPCDRRADGKLVCEPDPQLGSDEQHRLAQQILNAARPGCILQKGRPKIFDLVRVRDDSRPIAHRITYGPREPVLYAEIACPGK